MVSWLLVGGIIAFPLIVGLVWKVGAPHLFFALMAGELLARYFGHETDYFGLGEFSKVLDPLILIAPIIITAIFLSKTIQGGKVLLHIVPLVVTGLILAVFLLPILPDSIQQLATDNQLGRVILNFNIPIVGSIVVTQLVYLWIIHGTRKHRMHQKSEKH